MPRAVGVRDHGARLHGSIGLSGLTGRRSSNGGITSPAACALARDSISSEVREKPSSARRSWARMRRVRAPGRAGRRPASPRTITHPKGAPLAANRGAGPPASRQTSAPQQPSTPMFGGKRPFQKKSFSWVKKKETGRNKKKPWGATRDCGRCSAGRTSTVQGWKAPSGSGSRLRAGLRRLLRWRPARDPP